MSDLNVKTVSLDKLIPYWRNPRKNDVAVEKVMESIKKYGYQAPILVDKEMVIIAGHTRYQALKQLGHTKVTVVVTDMPAKKAKEYRVIDNKTSEYASWTDDLMLELKEFTDAHTLDVFFPNIKLETNFGDLTAPVTMQDMERAEAKLDNQIPSVANAAADQAKIVVTCPYCTETITLLKREIDLPKNWE
jgi:hypothetical protein